MVLEGRSVQLTGQAFDGIGALVPFPVSWSVVDSATECACGVVDQNGKFTAKTTAPLDYTYTRVRATAAGVSADIVITIRTFSDIRIELTTPNIPKDELDAYVVAVGQKAQFKATVLDQGGVPITEIDVAWSLQPKSGWCGYPDQPFKCGNLTAGGVFTAVGKFPALYLVGDKTQVCVSTSNPLGRVPDYVMTRCVPIKIV